MLTIKCKLIFNYGNIIFCTGIAPNIGDVRLFKQIFNSEMETYSGEIQIYLGDGHSPANWSKICKTNSFDHQETTILCEQMNLEYSSCSSVSSRYIYGCIKTLNFIVSLFFRSSDYPTFISNIECKDKIFLHILQCKYDLWQTECADVVAIECAKPKSKCVHYYACFFISLKPL